ncbi:amino acid ABC transporter permease [Castellaniella sp.]|uniref:amino acid ABC transporter permease n=1 Tax=Castellaniella sp. TaxID=1955812 RepID=UPI002AFFBE6A|nr:amino acid ABC transporter permease [Castellaniella sp.]
MNIDGLIFSFFNLDVIDRYYGFIVAGMWVTLQIAIAVVVSGLAMGFVLAFVRAYGFKPANALVVLFADTFRSLPPLVVIMMFFFAFPYIDLSMSAFQATWLALTLVLAAFAEEIFMAGIQATPRGLMEAGRSSGLGWGQTMWYIVWPQAFKLAVPPLTNRVIAITKSTSLGAIVGLGEILNNAQSASSSAGNPTPLTLCAIGSIVIFIPVVLAGRYLETRFH